MEDNSLLMIVLAFVLGYMASGMMKQMCGGRLVEGSGEKGDACRSVSDCGTSIGIQGETLQMYCANEDTRVPIKSGTTGVCTNMSFEGDFCTKDLPCNYNSTVRGRGMLLTCSNDHWGTCQAD